MITVLLILLSIATAIGILCWLAMFVWLILKALGVIR
jgi:hypothetical protein